MSQTCDISNGVKQGGIASQIIYSNLIRILRDSKIGCRLCIIMNLIMVVCRKKKKLFNFLECLVPKTIHNVHRHTILSIYIVQGILF